MCGWAGDSSFVPAPPLLRASGTSREGAGKGQGGSCRHRAVGKGGQSHGGVSSSPISFPPPGPLKGRGSQSLVDRKEGVRVCAPVSLFGILLKRALGLCSPGLS